MKKSDKTSLDAALNRRGKSAERKPQPIDNVRWIDPATLKANNYNPNRVFAPELRLLKLSILETGWTQPVVVFGVDIVDGFHRWQLASHDPDIIRFSGGQVPIVEVKGLDAARMMAATVRHNRARGQHGILRMGEIVRNMTAAGMTAEQVQKELGMEAEEYGRLADMRGSPQQTGKESFGLGWIPDASKKSRRPTGSKKDR